MSRHESLSGNCAKCEEIINSYQGIHPVILSWFKAFQAAHPEVHTSCAGRGREDQEECFKNGTSKAHYGHSSHNYNCGMDLFVILPTKNIYDLEWFRTTLPQVLTADIEWYGKPGSPFYELPHVEVKNWRDLRDSNQVKLVE